MSKCIIIRKYKYRLFRAMGHSGEPRSRRLHEKYANSLDTHRYFTFYHFNGYVNGTQRFMSSSLSEITLALWFKGKSVNAVGANNRRLF